MSTGPDQHCIERSRMASPTRSPFRHPKVSGDVYLLCDLTEVIEFFRKTLRAEHTSGDLEMPEFVAYGTTPVLLDVTSCVDLNCSD